MKHFALLFLWFITSGFCLLGSDGNYHSDEDPFVNAAKHDFRLKPGACGIDIGATLPEVTMDFDGVKRPQGLGYDIGAFEFVPTTIIPATPKDLIVK